MEAMRTAPHGCDQSVRGGSADARQMVAVAGAEIVRSIGVAGFGRDHSG